MPSEDGSERWYAHDPNEEHELQREFSAFLRAAVASSLSNIRERTQT
jgi:hypothetical protein